MISEERLRAIALASGFGPTYPDAERFARAVEADAYEAAARLCEKHTFRQGGIVDECAAAIRALKGA